MEKYIEFFEFVVEGETPITKETRIVVSKEQLQDPKFLDYLMAHYPNVDFTVKEGKILSREEIEAIGYEFGFLSRIA